MGYERNYRSMSSEAVARVTMNKVYGWMSLALAVSTLAALLTVRTPALLNLVYGNSMGIWVLIIAELVLVVWLTARLASMSFTKAATLMGLYAALNGVMLSSVFLLFRLETIYTAFLTTALTFAGMSAVGYFTKSDLSRMGSFLLMALLGLIIATVVNIFLSSSTLDAIITYVGVFIFVGLTAYDTQKVKRMLQAADEGVPGLVDTRKIALMGALNLYLDFINLFLYILRIFGNRR